MKKILTYVVCCVVVEVLGFVAGMLTRERTQIYADTINKPPLSPPGIAFPIAWTILYALMGIGIARIIMAESSEQKKLGIIFFIVQLVLNLAWCFIFFGAQKFGLALIELICIMAAAIAMIVTFLKVDKAAGVMQIPYIAWLCFAAYLNAGAWILNR